MKKILIIMMSFILAFSLFSCGGPQTEAQETEDEGTEAENTVSVESGSLMDASWKKTASEDEIDEYLDNLYGSEEVDKSIRINALELYKKLALNDVKEGKNTMVSPLSFMVAMGLLENGAGSETLREIEDAFGYDIGSFNDWYDNWSKLIMVTGGGSLKLANSVWFKNDSLLRVNEEFLRNAAEIFDAQAYMEPFDDSTLKEINGWVSDNTDGMIPAILDSIPKEGMMYLINATCFEGAWLDPYEDEQIREGEIFTREDGTKDTVNMLYSKDNDGRFFENDLVTGTFKNYDNGFDIMFLLPKEGQTLEDVIEGLKGDDIRELRANGQDAKVNLVIPEFSFDYTAPDSIASLKEMGINTVFDEELADLTPMAVREDGWNLYVNIVIHKTHIELDREGTKAAASTAIGIAKATSVAAEKPAFEVRLDRPFIFVISDTSTYTPVFIGTVSQIG